MLFGVRGRDLHAVLNRHQRDSGGAGAGRSFDFRRETALSAHLDPDHRLLRADADLVGVLRRSERRPPRYSQVLLILFRAAYPVQHPADAARGACLSAGRHRGDDLIRAVEPGAVRPKGIGCPRAGNAALRLLCGLAVDRFHKPLDDSGRAGNDARPDGSGVVPVFERSPAEAVGGSRGIYYSDLNRSGRNPRHLVRNFLRWSVSDLAVAALVGAGAALAHYRGAAGESIRSPRTRHLCVPSPWRYRFQRVPLRVPPRGMGDYQEASVAWVGAGAD